MFSLHLTPLKLVWGAHLKFIDETQIHILMVATAMHFRGTIRIVESQNGRCSPAVRVWG